MSVSRLRSKGAPSAAAAWRRDRDCAMHRSSVIEREGGKGVPVDVALEDVGPLATHVRASTAARLLLVRSPAHAWRHRHGIRGSLRRVDPTRPRAFLVADDSVDMRWIVTRLIRRSAPDATIIAVKDGGEALDALRDSGEGEGVVVISDYDMGPGRTGTQLLAEIAILHPKARRVLLTGYLPEAVRHGASQPHHVLPKEAGLASFQLLLSTL